MAPVCLGALTEVFLYALTVPVLPFVLTERLNVDPDDVGHGTAIFLATYNGGLFLTAPFSGCYADRAAERRRPLLFSVFVLAAATVVLCQVQQPQVLVVARFAQRASAAMVNSVGVALLSGIYGRYIGAVPGLVEVQVSISLSYGLLGMAFAAGGAQGSLAGGHLLQSKGLETLCVVTAAFCALGGGAVAMGTTPRTSQREERGVAKEAVIRR